MTDGAGSSSAAPDAPPDTAPFWVVAGWALAQITDILNRHEEPEGETRVMGFISEAPE